MAKKWEKETLKGAKLPKKVKPKGKSMYKAKKKAGRRKKKK